MTGSVMDDERDAIRSLFLYNEMITAQTKTDYKETPYWGCPLDHTRTTTMNGRKFRRDKNGKIKVNS